MSVDSQGAATAGIGKKDRQEFLWRLTDADIITSRDGGRRLRARVPERTAGALANNVVWLAGETVAVALVLVLALVVGEIDPVSLIGAQVFVLMARAGAEFRQQVRLAHHGMVVDGVVVSLSRLGFLDPDWKPVKVRFVTAQGSTRSCRMVVRRAAVGKRVTVRHDPWWPWRTAWGPSGGALVFLAVARLVGGFLAYFLLMLAGMVALRAML
ncbi:hypothetical protein CC117_27975 [Parafrankia colletiae]|uniref:Uncharacterized protein n=1 Tax=Parafrankia colletiae TaxID=573497 RepID=A0A1S1Q8U4_9ACTN|nr:DUF3592 domain-containing protein [Parafrankia colletiae]MCK9903383.1 hypothetical protein [Frankia sp. Cpl3]OHV30006.1 hypothetical protein CC117_27975 [Parafrankia colletiae]